MIIAGVLLVTMVAIMGINFLTSREDPKTLEYKEELTKAQVALEQADTFLLQGERAQAAELLTEAEEAAVRVLNSETNTLRSNAQFILAEIDEKKDQVENAKRLTPQLLADLGVKNDNLEAI